MKGEDYLLNLNSTVTQESPIKATRGTIYDRYGRPIAVNETAFTVKIDPSIQVESRTAVIQKLVELLEANDEEIIDTFPISEEEPFTFSFGGSATRETNWKRNMILDTDLTAAEAIEKLRERFQIPEETSNEEARKILNLMGAVYMERYKLSPISVATDVSEQTIAQIEEQNDQFQSVYIEVDSLRYYPEGKYLSHILGYIRKISAAELAVYEEYGYTEDDIVGKDGIEKAFELQLNGTDGTMLMEIQNIGRRVNSSVLEEPIPGGKVYLTIDAELQRYSFDVLEEMMIEILINKLNGISPRESPITVKDVLFSLINGNHISFRKIFVSDEGSVSHKIRELLLEKLPDNNFLEKEEITALKQTLMAMIDSNEVPMRDIFLIMYEQELISADEALLQRIETASNVTLRQILIEKIEQKELTPQIINLDPSTGSLAVVNIHDGSLLAAVSYPSYDNNEFVNNFNNEYWLKLNSEDLTTPMINRVFNEPRAPGSTFKMLSALAGLRAGVITPTSTIYDEGTFTKAGPPHANCWLHGGSGVSHGHVNIMSALEVSCNYFFFEMAYRMGNRKDGNALKSIEILNEYMVDFGLGLPTGVEIPEIYYSYSDSSILRISSPQYFNYISNTQFGRNAAWSDGDTIRTAIGQSFNSYTVAIMAKYMATLANGGTRYKMHLLDRIESYSNELLVRNSPVVEKELNIPQEHLDVVYRGMLAVTEGNNGTATRRFEGLPIQVAGKTGTAQQEGNRNNHSSFGGFAPYDDPQIAVYVLIPYGDTPTTPSSSTQVARKVIEEYFSVHEAPLNHSLNNSLSR